MEIGHASGSHAKLECHACGNRIMSYARWPNDVEWDHVYTAEEEKEHRAYTAMVHSMTVEDAEEAGMLKDLAVVEGRKHRRTSLLCSECLHKVRSCRSCIHLDPRYGCTLVELLAAIVVSGLCDPPRPHACSAWTQARPFTEEELIKLLEG